MCLLQVLVGTATPEALGFWQTDKGKVTKTWKGKVRKRANVRQGKKGRGLMGCHDSIHSKRNCWADSQSGGWPNKVRGLVVKRWMDGWMDGWIDGWMDRRVDGRTDGGRDGRIEQSTAGRLIVLTGIRVYSITIWYERGILERLCSQERMGKGQPLC